MTKATILLMLHDQTLRQPFEQKLKEYFQNNGVLEHFDIVSFDSHIEEVNAFQNSTVTYIALTYDKLIEHLLPFEKLLQTEHAPIERVLFVKQSEWPEVVHYYLDGTINHLIPIEWDFPFVLDRFLFDCRIDKTMLAKCPPEFFQDRLEWERLQQINFSLSQQNRKLLTQASLDGLTELANRREFDRLMIREVARSNREHRPFSVIMCDVDFFKHYNDHFGHPAGDEVLKTIADLFRKRLRVSDIPARYGGEEFVILLPNTTKEQAILVAEALRKRVEQHPFPYEEFQPNGDLTISLGVSTFGDDGVTIEEIISAADKELYRAKHAGRNCVKASILP
ncbi:MAG: GGDEF domain-containing protein [bacterium]|nr:GGDEF domain-containing protein [bacterium]